MFAGEPSFQLEQPASRARIGGVAVAATSSSEAKNDFSSKARFQADGRTFRLASEWVTSEI